MGTVVQLPRRVQPGQGWELKHVPQIEPVFVDQADPEPEPQPLGADVLAELTTLPKGSS